MNQTIMPTTCTPSHPFITCGRSVYSAFNRDIRHSIFRPYESCQSCREEITTVELTYTDGEVTAEVSRPCRELCLGIMNLCHSQIKESGSPELPSQIRIYGGCSRHSFSLTRCSVCVQLLMCCNMVDDMVESSPVAHLDEDGSVVVDAGSCPGFCPRHDDSLKRAIEYQQRLEQSRQERPSVIKNFFLITGVFLLTLLLTALVAVMVYYLIHKIRPHFIHP